MRSQVQVLAGPPPNPAGQGALGSELGALAVSLGRAGAARPSPPASPLALPGPSTRASGATATTHRGRPPSLRTPATRQVGSLALQPAPVPTPSHKRRTVRTPAWPAWSGSGQARRPPSHHPARSAADTPLTTRGLGSAARIQASSPVNPAARRRGSPQGPRPVPVLKVARCTGLVPTPQPDVGGDGHVRTDRGGHQTAGRWTGGHQMAGHRTGWTLDGLDTGWRDTGLDGWTAGPGRRNRTGGHRMLDADRDRRHGRHPGLVGHGDDARPLDAGWTLRREHYRDGPGHRRDSRLQVMLRRPAGASAHCCPQTITGRA
jgi:hypothetical protein